jgi:hypothetical protein
MELRTQSLPGIGGLLVEITADHLDAGNTSEFKRLVQPHLDSNQRVVAVENRIHEQPVGLSRALAAG